MNISDTPEVNYYPLTPEVVNDLASNLSTNTPATAVSQGNTSENGGNSILTKDTQSSNYVSGVAGWKLGTDGIIRAVGVVLSGAITASSGSITGAFSVLGALTIGTAGTIGCGQTAYNTGIGYWWEYNTGTPRTSIGDPAGNYLTWDGSALTVKGVIIATTATIASTTADTFTINSDLTDANVDLVFGRTTGGNATMRWNGTTVNLDKTLTIGGTGIVLTTRTLTTGNGLTGGGDLSADRTFAVGAGTLITVGADTVGITPDTADYGYIGSSTTPWTATWKSISTLAGAGLTHTTGILAVGAGNGITVNADDVALTTPGTLTISTSNSSTGNHTHAITSSSNPGAAASLLASDASGFLTLEKLTTPILSASANLTISPAGDVIFDPTGNDILPNTGYDLNIGSLTKKYLTLHAAELWVETLVAQNTIATIGGRILVGPTTELIADLTAIATTIDVKHNEMASGDRVYMEANGSVEFMSIDSAATPITGGYRYTVTRNLDGSGANAWSAGDAIFNTGTTGDGFIDLYSVNGVKAASEAGPTIVGNVRNSATYNDWTSHWAIGNLNGLYGYGVTTYGVALGEYAASKTHITLDSTNGYRIFNGTATVIGQWDTSGNISVGNTVSEHVYITSTGVQIKDSTTIYANLTAGAFSLGDTANEHVLINTSGVALKDGVNIYAQFAATTTVGLTTSEHVSISSTAIQFKDGATVLTDISGGNILVGQTGAGQSNVYITSGAVYLRNNTTNKISLDTSGNINLLGNLSVGTDGAFYSGMTAYNTGTGWWWEYNAGTPRFSIGNSSDTSKLLLWDGTDLIVNNSSISNNDKYGDGSDGDVTISVDTTLTSDMYYDDLTIATGKILNSGGYRIYVKGILTYQGTGKISVAGGNGGNGGDAAYLGGTAGTAGVAAYTSDGTLPRAYSGGAGKAGGNGGAPNVQNPGITGGSNADVAKATSGAGSNGGHGAKGEGGAQAGGGIGTGGASTGTIFNIIKNSISAFNLFDLYPTFTALTNAAGSGGGGSGGSDNGNTNNGGGGGSGGAGACGGFIFISARKIITVDGNIYIDVSGGNGGNGGSGGKSEGISQYGGKGGGGGGGRGGTIVLIYSSKTGTGTTDITGGTKGLKGATGCNTDATDGNDGGTGKLITIVV